MDRAKVFDEVVGLFAILQTNSILNLSRSELDMHRLFLTVRSKSKIRCLVKILLAISSYFVI